MGLNLFNFMILSVLTLTALGNNILIKSLQNYFQANFSTIIVFFQVIVVLLLSFLILLIRDLMQKKPQALQTILRKVMRVKKNIILMVLCYLITGVLSIKCLQYVSVTVFLAGRRVRILFLLLLKWIKNEQEKIDKAQIIYGLVMFITFCIAIHEELKSDAWLGVLLLSVVNAGSVMYTELLDVTQKQNLKIDSLFLLFQKTFLAIIPLLLLIFIDGSYANFINHQYSQHQYLVFFLALISISLLSFIFYISLFLSTKYSNAFQVLSSYNIRDFFAAILDIFLFEDINPTITMIVSLSINFIAVFIYNIYDYFNSYEQIQKSESEEQLIKDGKIILSLEQEGKNNNNNNNNYGKI